MPSRRSRSREKSKKEGKAKNEEGQQESKVKAEVIDLLDDDDGPPKVIVKAEVKREVKEKKAKVKKEKDSPGRKEKAKDKERRRKRSRSESRRRSRSSSSCSSSSSSTSAMYRRFKPYTKVQLVNLVRKADLNGMLGTVVHPSMAVSPCPPGCILVRLETGREIAVKPANLGRLASFHHGPMQAPVTQEARLQQVLKTIKMNVDNVMERTMALRDGGSHAIMDDPGRIQGGIGHML